MGVMYNIGYIPDLVILLITIAVTGFACHKAGLPGAVGFLVTGMLLGPHGLAPGIINDSVRVEQWAQVSLVFLMFASGLNVRLQRLRTMGLTMLVAMLVAVFLILSVCRLGGRMMGWPESHGWVIAAMLMVSSSVVTRACLREANAVHGRFGQMAWAITTLDDVVGVAMLALLSIMPSMMSGGSVTWLGPMLRFQSVLVGLGVMALLLLPPLLHGLGRHAPPDLRVWCVSALLLGMALVSHVGGGTVALGSFILGVVIASTRLSASVDHAMGSLRNVGVGFFFVTMGMLVDLRLMGAVWHWIALLFVLTLLIRFLAVSLALMLVGEGSDNAIKTGFALAPVGEFSLLIALTSVQAGLVPPHFYAMAAGLCLLTALTTPFMMHHAHGLNLRVNATMPPILAEVARLHQMWRERFRAHAQRSVMWKLLAPRVTQTGLLVLLVMGLFAVAHPMHAVIQKWWGGEGSATQWGMMVFWLVIWGVVAAPLVALWRNLEAVSMICAAAATPGNTCSGSMRILLERSLKGASAVALIAWLISLLPLGAIPNWSAAVLLMTLPVGVGLFWRHLIRWQSRWEVGLRDRLAPKSLDVMAGSGWPCDNMADTRPWPGTLREITIQPGARAAGLLVRALELRERFNCTLTALERQGIIIAPPEADTMVFANDVLLLLGRDEDLFHAERWVNEIEWSEQSPVAESSLKDLGLNHLHVPIHCRHAGRTLAELGCNRLFGVQIVGIQRDHQMLLSPGGSDVLRAGDRLWVVGRPEHAHEMGYWLNT